MPHSYGHIPNSHDHRDFGLHDLVGAFVPALPDSLDLSPRVGAVRDQGQTSSCVAQALAMAIHVRVASWSPSVLAIYGLARAIGHMLGDHGCRPRDAARAIAKFGVVPEPHWPWVPEHVDYALPWDILAEGTHHRVTGYYALHGAIQTRQALALGYPVPVAIRVDAAFEAGVGVIGPPMGEILGSHMVCVVGYAPGKFRIVNSWGESWGENGFAWLSDEAIDSASDSYALSLLSV